MTLQSVLTSVAIATVGVIAIMGLSNPVAPVPFSASAGPDFDSPVFFRQTATPGGNVFATSSQGAVTYTAAQLLNTSVIQHTATGALTATLPASSTLSTIFLPRAGDSRTIYLTPITTNITLAGGTGTDLNMASSSTSCLVNRICRLDFVRKANSDIEVQVTN